MVKLTQARGSADTWSAPWGIVEPSLRPITITLVVALVLHVVPPLVPVDALIGWAGFLLADEPEPTEVPEQDVIVPIELDMFVDEPTGAGPAGDDGASASTEPRAAGAPATEVVVVPMPREPKPPPVPPPPAPEETQEDKPAPPPAEPKTPAPSEPPAPSNEDEPAKDAEAKPKLRLKGAFDAAADNNVARAEHPNVNIYIAGSELRKRDLATMFGDLLNSVPEWKLLLGGTDIDPIAHFDHVLISAPHMRNKARWIVARVGYNVPDETMKAAIDTAAKRSKGAWLGDYALPVASVDDDTRRVVLIEDRDQIVVLPKEAEAQIPKLEKVGRFPREPAAGIFLDMIKPANAFASKFPFPKSIEKLTVRLSLPADGSYLIEMELLDESPEAAKKSAKLLEEEIEKLRPVPGLSLLVKAYFIGKPTFETEGEIIRASAPVTRAQVERIMKLVQLWLDRREQAAAEKAASAKEKKRKAAKKKGSPNRRKAEVTEPAKKKPKGAPPSKGLFDHLRDNVE